MAVINTGLCNRRILVGADKIQFDKKALQGLADQLAPSVQIITNKDNAAKGTDSSSELNLTNRVEVLDKYYLRLCPGKIESESEEPFQQWNECIKTNEVRGIILDLRNVSTGNYSAAADFVSVFIKDESISNLFSLGNVTYAVNKELRHSDSPLAQLPLSILINSFAASERKRVLRYPTPIAFFALGSLSLTTWRPSNFFICEYVWSECG